MHPAVTRSPKPSSGSLNCRSPSVRSEQSSVLQSRSCWNRTTPPPRSSAPSSRVCSTFQRLLACRTSLLPPQADRRRLAADRAQTDPMTLLDVQPIRATFQGDLFTPETSGYDAACRIWNASVNKRPALIARCSGLADIIAAVDFARENGLLTADPRRRSQRGRPCPLRRWHRHRPFADARRACRSRARTVRVQGGATLGDLDRETHAFGLAVPCGIVPKTGIGGLTLGGGVGWLVRKYGMTIDNLLSCQIVTADGKVLTASRVRERGPLLGSPGRRRELRSCCVVRIPGPSGSHGPGWPACSTRARPPWM